MFGYQSDQYNGVTFSVAFSSTLERQLSAHFKKPNRQEDLTFAYWRPSRGAVRYTAILNALALPTPTERHLHGNVAFTSGYLERVLDERPKDCGIALLHSHLGPGWQGMSSDDVVAERDRLAGVAASSTDLPLLGLTYGTDQSWSARFWLRAGRHAYDLRWAATVRSVGECLRTTFHPEISPPPLPPESQAATISVWGNEVQESLARTHVGIVGLGSVGSIVAEGLARTGVQRVTLIDPDRIEVRNLDRTLGSVREDADQELPKVQVSKRLLNNSHTSEIFSVDAVQRSVLEEEGLAKALDCDLLLSCVDRPWPRHWLNTIAYAHLIPVVDGGIIARVNDLGRLMHVDWRIHTIGPERACLYCMDALRRSDVALDRDGKLDDPDYVKGLSPADRERYGRRNVFAFSLSVASHQLLQAIGMLAGTQRVGGIGPQAYHAYPGTMEVVPTSQCLPECDVAPLTSTACTLHSQ